MDTRTLLADQRRRLGGQLARLSEPEWDTPTLCAGWTVRHVAAHLVMPFRYSQRSVVAGVLRARGDFNRYADRVARRDAALPTAELVRLLVDNAEHPYRPPGGGFEGALTDLVVHSLDIARPLGIDSGIDPATLALVLGHLVTPKSLAFFHLDLGNARLRAADVGWCHGDGPEVAGSAEDLVMLLGRRHTPLALSGDGAGRFLVDAS